MNKIDLIIDALEQADRMRRKQGYTEEYLQEALSAARELQALKPVAWRYKGKLHDSDPSDWASPEFVVTPLYTAPPLKPWVGLSDEEIEKGYETTGHYQTLRPQDRFAVFALARAIEAKLKEKNT